jgi:hypothetical protein
MEELLESKGHICRMLPKMHPELNPIESFWASMKVYLREVCNYSIAGLRKHLPLAANSVPVPTVRRYYRRVSRFSSMYHNEATGGERMPFKLREYVMKKYSRHRTVPKSALDAIDQDLVDREAKCSKRKRIKTELKEQQMQDIKKLRVEFANYRGAQAANYLKQIVENTNTYWPFDSFA